MSWVRYLALPLYALVLLPLACRERTARPPNIVLIVIDTLRADRLGVYGNPRGLTPFLDELAARGTTFANVYAPSSWTVPSVASLLTSRYASQHRTTTYQSKLADQEVTLAEGLAPLGYVSGGFSANFRLSAALGYAQGFQRWKIYVAAYLDVPTVRGDHLRRESLGWLDEVQRTKEPRPIFLYLHYMEPHYPYDPPEPFRSRYLRHGDDTVSADEANQKLAKLQFELVSDGEVDLLTSLYDGEVAAVDEEIRLLFTQLERRGILRDAIVVITSDHGEEFREHGLLGLGHGRSLYEAAIKIPLILIVPGFQGGKVVTQAVSLLDVAPTLMDLVGLPAEPRFEGQSLVPLLRPESWTRRLALLLAPAGEEHDVPDVLSELLKTGSKFDLRRHASALIRQPYKLLVGRDDPVMFDLRQDPGENEPVEDSDSAQVGLMIKALEAKDKQLSTRANLTAETREIDEATKEKLRALGYSP